MLLTEIKNYTSYIMGTFLGIGFIPKMSGTFASVAIALIWLTIPEFYFYNPIENIIFYDIYLYLFIGLILFSWLAVYICRICEKKFGHDASAIVIDEVIGYLIAILFLPKTLMIAVYALILFRIFDIAKPLFINKLQKLAHGWGIMLDDIAAGVCSNIILQILFHIKPKFFI